jgi:hypothetical protein
MRKSSIYFFVLVTLVSLGFALVQQAASQPENIKVLSYSWYIDAIGSFDVVGEVQNMGPNTISLAVLNGTVYAADGEAKAFSNPIVAYVHYLLPQQKAPFFMEFAPQASVTGDLSWVSLGVDHVDFTVYRANVTSSYLYQGLTVKSSIGAVDGEGVYWVSGTVQNSGSQTATDIRVIGTFYNAHGTVVAVGYTDPLTPSSLNPSSVASFKVGAFDHDETVVSSDKIISSYSLVIQAGGPILSGTPPSLPSSNSTSPTPPSDDGTSLPPAVAPDTQYVAVAVLVIVVIAGIILVFDRRKSQAKSQQANTPKSQTRNKKK